MFAGLRHLSSLLTGDLCLRCQGISFIKGAVLGHFVYKWVMCVSSFGAFLFPVLGHFIYKGSIYVSSFGAFHL